MINADVFGREVLQWEVRRERFRPSKETRLQKDSPPGRGGAVKVGFVGAGKVGCSLGKFFACGGIPVTGYFSRRRESSKEAALFTGTKEYTEIGCLIRDSDAVFLTVPDGAIFSVYKELGKSDISEKILCHCSGVLTAAEAFPDIARRGAYGYSIHPLIPVSSKVSSYRELAGAFFCIEGEGPHLSLWKNLLECLGARARVLRACDKVRYHAACAISSNLMCALIWESTELLKGCGFSEKEALEALAPLMRANLEHLIASGPVDALTGAVERGDADTVQRHLDCLESREEKEFYRLASKKLLEIAALKNPLRDYTELEKLLKREKSPGENENVK